jgi:hypothetical protein
MDQQKQASAATEAEPAPDMSRRSLLSGACKVAGPAIVTLYSGAALARSSNLISTKATQGAEQYKYRCLDTSSVHDKVGANLYDLGPDPMGRVTRISSTKQYFASDYAGRRTTTQVSASKMCADGGYFHRKDGSYSYTKVRVYKGGMVSATALSSFANDITYHDV